MSSETIALLVESEEFLGDTKQRCDVDLGSCGGSVAEFLRQVAAQLYEPQSETRIMLPPNTVVHYYDVIGRQYLPLLSPDRLKDRMKIRLSSDAPPPPAAANAATPPPEDFRPTADYLDPADELTVDVIATAVAQLSAFAFDDVPISDVALDNIVHSCRQRHPGLGPMTPRQEALHLRVRGALVSGYRRGKEAQRRNPLEDEVRRLRAEQSDLIAALERQSRRVAELETTLALTQQQGQYQSLVTPNRATVSTPYYAATPMATPAMPQPPPPSPAFGGAYGPGGIAGLPAMSLTPLLAGRRPSDDGDEGRDGLRTPPNTPQVMDHIRMGAPPLSPVQLPEPVIPPRAVTGMQPLSSSSGPSTPVYGSKPPTPPSTERNSSGAKFAISTSPKGPSTIVTPPAVVAPAAPSPKYTLGPLSAQHVAAAADANGDAGLPLMVSVFYNAYDPARRMTTKRGRAIALTPGPVPLLVQLQRGVARAFSRPALEVGYVHSDGVTRVLIDTNDALEAYLFGSHARGSRPVLQCFDGEFDTQAAAISALSAGHQPPIHSAGGGASPQDTSTPIPSRPTSAMRQSRPASVLSTTSTMSMPYDAENGRVLDDDELAFQFGLVSKDGKFAHKADVLTFLQSRYDDMGDTNRFQRLLAKFKRPLLNADEFGIVLLKIAAS